MKHIRDNIGKEIEKNINFKLMDRLLNLHSLLSWHIHDNTEQMVAPIINHRRNINNMKQYDTN